MLEPMHLYHAIHVKPCLQFLCSASFHRLEPQLKEARLGREASEYRIASTEKKPQKAQFPSSRRQTGATKFHHTARDLPVTDKFTVKY